MKQVAEGVFIHTSEFCESNATVVRGQAGFLLIDPGIKQEELAQIASDIHELGQPVVVGFSTHPHWDHLLWHAQFGTAPRFGTTQAADSIKAFLSDPNWHDRIVNLIPPDIFNQVPLDLMGQITGLAAETALIPWDGPKVRIIEHQAHAAGHAALLIEDQRVLVAGDMLSDILIPLLNMNAADPIADYLTALQKLENVASEADVFIPGHGSVGDANQMRARIEQDRKYLQALRDGSTPDDPRIGPSAKYDWVAGVHQRQLQQLAQKKGQAKTAPQPMTDSQAQAILAMHNLQGRSPNTKNKGRKLPIGLLVTTAVVIIIIVAASFALSALKPHVSSGTGASTSNSSSNSTNKTSSTDQQINQDVKSCSNPLTALSQC